MLTKGLIREAEKLSKHWNKLDDEGTYLGDDDDTVLERVPEWADSWVQIDSYDLHDLFKQYEDYYGVAAKGNTFEDLLVQTKGYNFVVEDYTSVGETYMLSDLVSHIYNFN
jgi:hypothetical protein